MIESGDLIMSKHRRDILQSILSESAGGLKKSGTMLGISSLAALNILFQQADAAELNDSDSVRSGSL